MEKTKEQPTNGTILTTTKASDVTPDDAVKQILDLADSLGYAVGVVALMPKTKTPVPIIEYLPDGVTVQLALVRKPNGDNSLLPA